MGAEVEGITGDRASLGRHVLPSLGHRQVSDLHLPEIDQLCGLMLVGELPKPREDDETPP